ncbi:MAG: ABC transporter permease [Proteobacteria bacterium]|nr:ABC transporter permease [Pseudomonadota bacterium]
MSTFKLAWRNVWRNKRRTLATVSAMSLALLVMILYNGLVAGYLYDMKRSILDLEVGDIQIHAVDFLENPSIYKRIANSDALLEKFDNSPYLASARLLASGLAAANDSSAGATLRGLDPDRDAKVSLVYQRIKKGEWIDNADPKGVVLGKRLARTLSADLGDELVVLSQGADGSMANELYTVRGVLRSVSDATDRTGIFMTTQAFRDLMVVPEGVHQIMVRTPINSDLDMSAAEVSQLAPGLDTKTWRQIMPTVANMLESTESAIYIMFLIVYIAIGIVILNAMLMAVFERIREFGVLKAIGMAPGKVLRLILAESGIQTGLAMIVGVALSIPGNWYLSTHGVNLTGLTDVAVAGISFDATMHSVVSTDTYIVPIVTLIAIVSVAVFYPALKAAFINPITAIHHK